MTRPTVAELAEQLATIRAEQEALLEAMQAGSRSVLLDSETTPVVVAPWAGVAKALVGAAVAGLGVLTTALTDGVLTPAEAVGAALAALTALAAVYRVENADAEP